MAQSYIVKQGESIMDVCFNANGSLYALNENLNLNNLNTYTPTLIANTVLSVSSSVYNNSAISQSNLHRFNSLSSLPNDIETQINSMVSLLEG